MKRGQGNQPGVDAPGGALGAYTPAATALWWAASTSGIRAR